MYVKEGIIKMENYNTVTALEQHDSIITALSDFPNSVMKTKVRKEKATDAAKKQTADASVETSQKAAVQREAGDHLNVFMLCTLVNKSAKQIKARAEMKGAFLPMTSVLRKVLSAYRLAAKDKNGPLATSNPDMNGLADLNRQILRTLTK
jgi:hypothetical protein